MFAYVNPIDALSGPHFLLAFGLYAAAVCTAAFVLTRSQAGGPRLPVPGFGHVDPHPVAYLRGGTNEVLRLIVFELVQDGFLKFDATAPGKDPDTIAQLALHPDASRLPAPSKAVFDYYSQPRGPGDLFKSPVRDLVDVQGGTYRQALATAGLLDDGSGRRTVGLARLFGSVALLVPFAYRFSTSLAHGHRNVGFLVLMLFAGLIALMLVTRRSRVTTRGRRYLRDLKTAYRPNARMNAGDAAFAGVALLPLVVAVNGTAALAGTQYAPMNKLFAAQSGGGSSGGCDSGGCGSSSSSSGGDGGGSSCGGGGCGGGGCS